MLNELQINTNTADDHCYISIASELVMLNHHTLDRKIENLLKQGIRKFILDMMGISYVDSSGLSSMIYVNHVIRKEDGKLLIANIKPEVISIIQRTGLEKQFYIFDSLEDAKAELKKG